MEHVKYSQNVCLFQGSRRGVFLQMKPTPIYWKIQGTVTLSLSWAIRVCARPSSSRALCRLRSLLASSFLLCPISFWVAFNFSAFTRNSSSREETRLRISDKDASGWNRHRNTQVTTLIRAGFNFYWLVIAVHLLARNDANIYWLNCSRQRLNPKNIKL